MSGAPVLVIGDVMTDVVARVDDPLALGSDTAAHVQTHQGGAGANVAAWLAALDVPVRFVGRVGADPFGTESVQVLRTGGVDVRVAVDDVRATGTVVVLVGADGERTMLPDAGANSGLTTDDVAAGDVASAGWLHVSGYTLLNPGSRDAGSAALAAARAAGVRTSVDVASAAPLQALGGKEFVRLTEGTDLVFCTLDEAEVLVGTRDPELAVARLTADYREVVLKLGRAGARWASEGAAPVTVPACPPSGAVVDSTGAGDAFCAAYLAVTLAVTLPVTSDGGAVADALAAGCRAGAALVTRVGTRPVPPPRDHARSPQDPLSPGSPR
ncbi:carbohydrate kinase family protein [Angustibacter luteus]|uniref:Carbohydrate kinase family protein n=1 Tax=Angustibacter luteus TaxID=658456 RepID=A0ABW1J8V1_9ACTN